ncbi:MAG: hypothetical protein MJ228_05010 [Bacilli bacterium]|nr:hypothetical protein [Bacilli bacterium]
MNKKPCLKLTIVAASCCLLSCSSVHETGQIESFLNENASADYVVISETHIKKGNQVHEVKPLLDDCLSEYHQNSKVNSTILECKTVGKDAYYAVLLGKCPDFDLCFLSVDPETLEAAFVGSITPSSLVSLGVAPDWIASTDELSVRVADGFDEKPLFEFDLFSLRDSKNMDVLISSNGLTVSPRDYGRSNSYRELRLQKGVTIKNPRSIFDNREIRSFNRIEKNEELTDFESLLMKNEIAREITKKWGKWEFEGEAEYIGQDGSLFVEYALAYHRWPDINYCYLVFEVDLEALHLSFVGITPKNKKLSGVVKIS